MCKFKKKLMLSLLVLSVSLITAITQADDPGEIDIHIQGNELSESNQTALGEAVDINVENVGNDVEVHIAVETPDGEIIFLPPKKGIDSTGQDEVLHVEIPESVDAVGPYKIFAVTTEVGVDDPTNSANWESQLVQEDLFINRTSGK